MTGKKKKLLNAQEYVNGVLAHDTIVLSQAITLIESSRPDHMELASEIISLCLPYSGKSIRIGITGVPGVGKSSFIEELGTYMTGLGRKLAVLAIDPSSKRSGGSIMGDKTRMENLSADKSAFIRPSPSAGSLGGVARKTRETIILCEAAGFDTIIIETVGVGQSEVVVHSMVDFFLLLMLAGAGDELQGIKRGIMEMADLIAITKADGDNRLKAEKAVGEYSNALHFLPPPESGWTPRAVSCSAYENTGVTEIWDIIRDYHEYAGGNDWFAKNRDKQSLYWLHQTIEDELKNSFHGSEGIQKMLPGLEKRVLERKHSPFDAAREILREYFREKSE